MVVCDNGEVYACHPDIGQCFPNSEAYCGEGFTEPLTESLEAGDVAAEAEAEENYHWETGLVNDDEATATNDSKKEEKASDESKPGDEEEEEAPYGVDGNWNDEPEGTDPDADWFDDLPTDSEELDPNGDYEDLVFVDGFFYHKDDVHEIFSEEELAGLGDYLATFDEMPDPEAYYDQDDEEAENRLWGFFVDEGTDSEEEDEKHKQEAEPEHKLERQNAMVFEEEHFKDGEVTLDEVYEAKEDMDDEWNADEWPTADADKEVLEQNDSQLFLVMFTMLAAMLFIMWLMLRNCQKNNGDEEDENKRKRGSYVPTRISAVGDESIELKDVEAYV